MDAQGEAEQWHDAPFEENHGDADRNAEQEGPGDSGEYREEETGSGPPEQEWSNSGDNDEKAGPSIEPGAESEAGEREANADTIGRFESPGQVDGHCITFVSPDSYEAGQYLRLRYAIEANREEDRGVVVGIFSPAAGDGKSLTAMNLSGALGQRKGNRVLFVDADLRRKSDMVRNMVAVSGSPAPGLSELLMDPDQYDIANVARQIGETNVWMVLTGELPVIPYEAFSSPQFDRFIQQARDRFDYVIIDAPPVLPVPDCKVIVRSVDGIVMVISANRTPRPMLAQALDNLGPEKLFGLVLNRSDQLPYRYYRYYGKYGYASRARTPNVATIAESSIGTNAEPGNDSIPDYPIQQ